MENSLLTPIDWDELLQNIEEENLIPVIGNEVYQFELNDKLTGIDSYLSGKLLEENNLEVQFPLTLAEVADALGKKKNLHIRDIVRRLKEIVDGIDFNFPVLENFLEINKLFFYLNTTVYNSILENITKKVRKQKVTSINFSIRSKFPDCENIEELTEPLIFNVFGSFKSADPALSEEEMLEFTASFKERMNDNAKSILDALKNKSLLFLGCTHPDWLIRFFLRVLSNERINDWLNRRSQIIVVNDQSDYRQKQYSFLKNYNVVTYDGNTNEFIQQLTTRWKQKNPGEVKPKTIFLSYTQKDVHAVEKLKQALARINNVTCWYDKEKLFSGDNFETTIIDNIRKADLFIPLLSQNSLAQQDKYVYDEWFKADTVNRFRELDGRKEKYLMPIVIDDADLNNSIVKKFYPQISIEKVPDGNPNDDFINRLKVNLNIA